MTTIESVDLSIFLTGSKQQRQALIDRLSAICHEFGFFYLSGHGISIKEFEQYFDHMKRFFALDQEKKAAIDKQLSPHFRGWEALGSELTNNKIDYREQLDIGPEGIALKNPTPYYMHLVGPNQWPKSDDLPGFQDEVVSMVSRLSEVARAVLRMMSVALKLSPTAIETAFGAAPCPYLKLIRYPPSPLEHQGVGTHRDSGYLTLLMQDQIGGLEAQSVDGQWHAVAPVPGTLVVNIGELMQLMTGNYFIAAPHRVMNTGNEERYSSAFFYSPGLHTALTPLPIDQQLATKVQQSQTHRNAGTMASRAQLLQGHDGINAVTDATCFGEKYWERWVRSYPEIAQRYYGDLLL